jgi:predicted deacylase
VDPKKMKGAILAVPVLNGPQFELRSAFLSPFDQLNMNRVFPGDPEGTLSRRTAHAVFSKIVSKADALCDCHGGDITEDLDTFVNASQGDDEEINRKAIEMARCFQCKTIFVPGIAGHAGGSSHTALDEFGIPCITSEAGTPANVRERHIRFHYDGIQNLLKYFGILEGEHVLYDAVINPEEYAVKAKRGGIWRPKVGLGQNVQAGQELGYMTDLFGNVLETYKTPEKGVIRFLRVWYSVNTGETLASVTAVD